MHAFLKKLLRATYASPRLSKWAVRVYAMLRPPPYRQAGMEFEHGLWNGICTFHSDDGRQIGENNACPWPYKQAYDTEHRICKFEDSRAGLPINVTSLRSVMAIWDDVLQCTMLLRERFVAHRRLGGGPLDLRQVFLFSKIGAAYPAYLARRGRHPVDALPPVEAALFMVGAGPFLTIQALMDNGDLALLDTAAPSAEALYAMADRSGTLVSPERRGCAGSRKHIVDYLDVAINGAYTQPLSSPAAQRALARIDDWDAFFAYLLAASRLELLVKLHRYLCAQELVALRSHPGLLNAAEQSLLDTSLARSHPRPAGAADGPRLLADSVRIAVALLADLDLPSLAETLAQAGLGGHGGAPQPAGDPRRAAAARLHLAAAILHPLCQAELDGLHRALGRHQGTCISVDELVTRSGGAGLRPLITQLQTATTQPERA